MSIAESGSIAESQVAENANQESPVTKGVWSRRVMTEVGDVENGTRIVTPSLTKRASDRKRKAPRSAANLDSPAMHSSLYDANSSLPSKAPPLSFHMFPRRELT